MKPAPIDRRPGMLPEITANGANVSYVLPIVGAKDATKLVIRCDDTGNVWLSIRRAD
jgi:hypothetical protein